MKVLARYFVRGLLFLVPAGATVYVVVWVFRALDGAVHSAVKGGDTSGWWVTGLGVVLLLGGITATGFLTSLFMIRPLVRLVERVLGRAPLVKLLYGALRDLVGAFVGDKKRFDQPVAVELAPGGPKALGFVTRQTLPFPGLPGHVAVYFPQSYNFAGSVLLFPAERVQKLEADSGEVMAFIVSGGVSGGGQQNQG